MHPFQACLAQTHSLTVVDGHAKHLACQCLGVTRRDTQAGPLVFDDLPQARGVGDDHRNTARHSLQDGKTQALGVARLYDQIRGRQQGRHVVVREMRVKFKAPLEAEVRDKPPQDLRVAYRGGTGGASHHESDLIELLGKRYGRLDQFH